MATVQEIANALNISATTVSMVLNNKPGISDKTRKLVLEKAKNLGYKQKDKSGKKTNIIELIILSFSEGKSEFDNPLFSEVMVGISIRAKELNYNLHVSYYRKNELDSAVSLSDSECSGHLLLVSDYGGPDFSILDMLKHPVVVLDKSFYDRSVDTVSVNHIQGTQLATEHLISLGHKELCFVQSPILGSRSFSERLIGFQQAVLAHEETKHCFNNMMYGDRQIEKFAERIKALPMMPTAFVCANDGYANQCIQALHFIGCGVPQDVSVIGFDNVPLCEAITPKLSTMNVPKQRMGALAVERLDDIIKGRIAGESIRIEIFADLILRESTAKVKTTMQTH